MPLPLLKFVARELLVLLTAALLVSLRAELLVSLPFLVHTSMEATVRCATDMATVRLAPQSHAKDMSWSNGATTTSARICFQRTA